MKGYFSRLIRQTGIALGQEQSPPVHQLQTNKNGFTGHSNAYDQPEPMEVEEIIEISAPSNSGISNDHEVDKESRKTSIESNTTIKPHRTNSSETISQTHTQFVSTATQTHSHQSESNIGPTEIGKLRKGVGSPFNRPEPTQKSGYVRESSDGVEIQASSVTVSESESKPESTDNLEARNSAKDIEYSEVIEKKAVPPSIEQHVYISKLPEAYQTAIKEWLLAPTNGDKNQPINQENLQKAIKRKQHSHVTLKSDDKLAHAFSKMRTNEERQGGDLHLSIGNINLTVEETKPVKQPHQSADRPDRKTYSGSSRLSRHYVKVRW